MLDNEFVVRGVRVIKPSGRRPIVSMPQCKFRDGKYRDRVFPITAKLRQSITQRVLQEYYNLQNSIEINLTDEEKEILESIEKGESKTLSEDEKNRYIAMFKNSVNGNATLKIDKIIVSPYKGPVKNLKAHVKVVFSCGLVFNQIQIREIDDNLAIKFPKGVEFKDKDSRMKLSSIILDSFWNHCKHKFE
jgi:DNA-binding cell septation regulator SpoVG